MLLRKIAGSIPDEVIEIFFSSLPNSSSSTAALELVHFLTEMSSIHSFWPSRKADNHHHL